MHIIIDEIKEEDLLSVNIRFKTYSDCKVTINNNDDEGLKTAMYEYLQDKYLACRYDGPNITTLLEKKKYI